MPEKPDRNTLVPEPIDQDLIATEDPFAEALAQTPVDPFARAKQALEAARLARGGDPEPSPVAHPSLLDDPLARANAALETARAARDAGTSTDVKLDDALREAQLRKLKRQQEDEES